MEIPGKARAAFDPYLERVVYEVDTSSDRLRTKLNDRYAWCFCEFCWRTTEYSTTLEAPHAVERRPRGNGKVLPITNVARATAQKRADAVVDRYERALTGEFGRYEAAKIWRDYCDVFEMRGDRSVEGFRDQVERRMLLTEWGRSGEVLRPTRLPKQTDKTPKPSKLYCAEHNPRRSAESRRAYQRERRYADEYATLIQEIWRLGMSTGHLATWDIDDHARVRREAFRQLQASRAPTSLIDEFLDEGIKTHAEIARQLGISRQAVSAAIKRRQQKAAAR